jgi:branched-chain amino acid transport system ATP-binding protein
VLLLNPKLLLLDEPSQGLAPLIVKHVFDIIVAARNAGTSVLLIEQNVRAAVKIADRAYVLDHGAISYSGPASDIAQDEKKAQELAGATAEKWEFPEDD